MHLHLLTWVIISLQDALRAVGTVDVKFADYYTGDDGQQLIKVEMYNQDDVAVFVEKLNAAGELLGETGVTAEDAPDIQPPRYVPCKGLAGSVLRG